MSPVYIYISISFNFEAGRREREILLYISLLFSFEAGRRERERERENHVYIPIV